jgi:hypothetical protein
MQEAYDHWREDLRLKASQIWYHKPKTLMYNTHVLTSSITSSL